MPTSLRCLLPTAICFFAACSPVRDNPAVPAAEGEGCGADVDCGAGLVCAASGTCTVLGEPGTAARTEDCFVDDDCRFGLVCNNSNTCGDSRKPADAGEKCTTDHACADGLLCAHDGTCAAVGAPGTTPIDGACEGDDTCGIGLVCGAAGACTALPAWPGVECPGTLEGPPRLLFDVPRGAPASDFFTLPYPNDIRARGASIDLSGFPGADFGPAPADLLGTWLAAMGEQDGTFGPNQAAIFRFSTGVDFATLVFGGDSPNFLFVDVTPGSDTRGRPPRSRFYATGGRSRYICHNWLGIRPSEGTPLRVDHTYAVVFRRGLKSTDGALVEASDDFRAVIGSTPPSHPALRSAWTRYARLRDWLTEAGIPADDLIGATVFTTGDPSLRMATMAAAVEAAPAPTLEDLTVCGAGVQSPCAAGRAERACGTAGGFTEVHGHAMLPSYLQGVAPFSEWGGEVDFEGGTPRLQRQAPVCVSVALPNGAPPAEGFPVAIFAHDLGGHFRSAIDRGLAARLTAAGWAVLGYDRALHGTRYDGTTVPEPEVIAAAVDDLNRPGRMRDLGFQESADLFALTRMLQNTRVPVGGDARVRLDGANIAFIGHGRGAEIGVPFLSYDPRVRAGVLAGGGAGYVDLLRLTEQPINLGAELSLGFAELDFNGMHPALHVLQEWLDDRDPVNYGAYVRRPPDGVPGKHVFQLYGVGDTVTPASTQDHLAISLRIVRVGPELETLNAISPAETTPLKGNVRISGANFTQGIKQYPAAGGDGHDVLFGDAGAADVVRFLQGMISDADGVPSLE